MFTCDNYRVCKWHRYNKQKISSLPVILIVCVNGIMKISSLPVIFILCVSGIVTQ